jgi:hypothetical protein
MYKLKLYNFNNIFLEVFMSTNNTSPTLSESMLRIAEAFLKSRDKGAIAGETCAWCGTVMNEKAMVCTGCHADRVMVPKRGPLISYALAVLALVAFFSFIGMFLGLNILVALVIIAASVFGIVYMVKKVEIEPVYRKKH